MAEQTFGQKAVGLSFNPSGDDAVGQCKQQFATMIDDMQTIMKSEGEERTMKSVIAEEAILKTIDAQMWVVKALTWKD